MTKNLGPSVSGYDVPEGRAWETVVFQSGKPVLDRELILSEDIDGGAAQSALRRTMPSGWLSDDFLTTASSTSAIFNAISVAATIEIPASRAHVNGWILDIQYSNTSSTSNRIDLGAGPAGAGTQRTDLVILEVWRRLISASPDATGKSASGRIWRNGNVKVAPADDLTLNYVDDILDTNVGTETTKRVQIQYRLRVVAGVDLFSNPYGIDDPTVFANSVPASAAAPNGVATVFTFANQSASGDPGLWIAGDGNPVNTLGTVDGYMYALPLLAVFRRNTTAFARVTNQNGGVASPGPSDRPDGLFSDIIASVDLLDLRQGVSPNGWSLAELLEKNTNAILDNSLRTEITDTSPYGGGCHGTTVLLANEIGGTPTGAAPESADQQFDAVRRRFSDRAIYETVTVQMSPPSGPNWANSDVVTIDPTSLPVYPYPAFNWSSFAPSEVLFLDILEAHWAGPTNAHKSIDAEPSMTAVSGLGASPIVSVSIQFGTIAPLSLTNESLYVTLLVAYPRGVGLTHTPVEDYGSNSFALNTAPLSAASPVSFSSFGPRTIDAPHREVQLEYQTVSIAYVQGSGSAPTNTVTLPERAIAAGLTVTTTPVQGGAPTLSASGRVITLTTTPTANTLITVNYVARRPVPQLSSPQMAIYFRAAAPQMARNAILSGSLTVIPKLVSGKLLSMTAGSGSQDESYPFATGYVQTGGIFPTLIGTYNGESDLAGTSEISVADFDAATGQLNLPTYISMVANPEQLMFTRGLGDIDVEGRTFFPGVTPSIYAPNAYAQDLSNPDRHKNVLPILAELAADSPLGYRGQLVIILLIRYAVFDEINGVFFDADPNENTTSASVFRVKGLLLNKRAS